MLENPTVKEVIELFDDIEKNHPTRDFPSRTRENIEYYTKAIHEIWDELSLGECWVIARKICN